MSFALGRPKPKEKAFVPVYSHRGTVIGYKEELQTSDDEDDEESSILTDSESSGSESGCESSSSESPPTRSGRSKHRSSSRLAKSKKHSKPSRKAHGKSRDKVMKKSRSRDQESRRDYRSSKHAKPNKSHTKKDSHGSDKLSKSLPKGKSALVMDLPSNPYAIDNAIAVNKGGWGARIKLADICMYQEVADLLLLYS